MSYLVGGGEDWGVRRGQEEKEEELEERRMPPLGEMDHKHVAKRNSKYGIYHWEIARPAVRRED